MTGSDHTQAVRICIADDHQMFVEAMRLILDASPGVEVVSVARDGNTLLKDIMRHAPDIALVDITMDGPGYRGIAAEVARIQPTTRLIALTMHLDRPLAELVIASGFSGYVVKDAAVSELLVAIRAAGRGETFLSGMLGQGDPGATDDPMALTTREVDCLRCAAQGQINREIGETLGISERTVKFHFENIFRKLDARSRGEAVAIGRRRQIL